MKRTVLITGGSRGIGRCLVESFGINGYNVAFLFNKSENEAHDLVRLMQDREQACIAVRADISDIDEVKAAYREITSMYGFIDTVINNAGISHSKLFFDETDADYERVMGVNLRGVFNVTKTFCRDMISEQFGRIINISSMWGVCGASTEVLYSTAKAGVIGMTKALSRELAPSKITVNAITPGLIDTDMNKDIPYKVMEQMISDTPVGRIGKPKDIANAALFLSDINSDFITGQIIGVDGGFI